MNGAGAAPDGRRRALLAAAVASPAALAGPALPEDASWPHAWSAFGEPRYPRGFSHFDWVRPDAPRGGRLVLRNPDLRNSFDKLNPFSSRGVAPAGLQIFVFESLAVLSGDEPLTMYGLLAEGIRVADDYSSVTYRLHPGARFSDGSPVLADDVLHSWSVVTGPQSSVGMRSQWRGVAALHKVDTHTVRFELTERHADAVLNTGALRVFSRRWGGGKPNQEVVMEPPIASGPYRVGAVTLGRQIELVRNPDYWAAELGVRRGMFNFDRIVYRYYKDPAIAREAFKAGDIDLYRETDASAWVRLHRGPKWEDGRISKEAFESGLGTLMTSFIFNMRRPLFADRRVRQALDLSFDFDSGNHHGLFRRAQSMFNDSEFAAQGLPSAGELQLLEPWRAQLPEAVFGLPYQAPSTQRDPRRLRRHLLQARALLEQAGWTLDAAGVLRNGAGQPFVLEFLGTGGTDAPLVEWRANLEMLGIRLSERVVDGVLYLRRLNQYEWDLFLGAEGAFVVPNTVLLREIYGAARQDGRAGARIRGIDSPPLEAMLRAMERARTREQLRDAARAFDRVAMWNHWGVPYRYTSAQWVSWWNRFGQPARRPRYFNAESLGNGIPRWPLQTWWALPAGAGRA